MTATVVMTRAAKFKKNAGCWERFVLLVLFLFWLVFASFQLDAQERHSMNRSKKKSSNGCHCANRR